VWCVNCARIGEEVQGIVHPAGKKPDRGGLRTLLQGWVKGKKFLILWVYQQKEREQGGATK